MARMDDIKLTLNTEHLSNTVAQEVRKEARKRYQLENNFFWMVQKALRNITILLAVCAATLLILAVDTAVAHNTKGVGKCGDHHAHCWKGKYQRTVTTGEKGSLLRVADCESGMNRHAHGAGGLYHSYFQYDAQTAGYAGFTRHVDEVSYWQQAVRTIRIVRREGWGRWPVCGARA